MNSGERVMQFSCIILGILKKETVKALNLIPKWHMSSLGKKNQTKDVCQKCVMMGKMSLQCLSEEQVCWDSLWAQLNWAVQLRMAVVQTGGSNEAVRNLS